MSMGGLGPGLNRQVEQTYLSKRFIWEVRWWLFVATLWCNAGCKAYLSFVGVLTRQFYIRSLPSQPLGFVYFLYFVRVDRVCLF